MLSLNTEDLWISLKELSGLFRFMPIIFLLPIPFTFYFIIVDKLLAGNSISRVFQIIGNNSVEALSGAAVLILIRSSVFVIPAIISYFLYSVLREIPTKSPVKTRHVMMSVSLGWLGITIISTLPYLLTGTLTSPIDAWFESMSGWSTTSFTLIKNLEVKPPDILFYRSLTQWLGGLGIIFMALSVLLRKGTVAMNYYSSDKGERKIKPSVKGTVIEIWKIYGVYTVLCFILLYLAGMSAFDALNHAMTALSTGGFSTHDANIGFFHDKPFIAPVLMFFMIIGSISFFVHFKLFEGRMRSLTGNIEFRNMISIIGLSTIIIVVLFFFKTYTLSDRSLLDAAFQSTSAMTSTGYSTVDLSSWPESGQMILVILTYIGGFYGSSAGGIKILRFAVILQVIAYSMKKLTVPKTAILRIKIGDRPVDDDELLSVFGFTTAYLAILAAGTLLLTYEFTTNQALFLSASALGNNGLSNVDSVKWFGMSDASKIILTFLMWVGRLEILPVLVFLSSLYVKKRTPL